MSKAFRRGLVVGKFCPLHLGHELLIRHAQAQCDAVLVLGYAKPGFEGYGRDRRAGWLRARFPELEAHVIDDPWLAARCRAKGLAPRPMPEDAAPAEVHRHFVAWLLLALLDTHVDAVFTSEDYGDGFAAVLAQRFGTPVQHVCVDRARAEVPVSGSLLRQDPMAHRQWLAPEVYADLVPRIALLGGESTGKTTLARALSEALGTVWVPEYGRELWEQRGGLLRYEDMEHIASTQVERELRLARTAHRWLVCDTTPLTTRLYSESMFQRTSRTLEELARRPYTLSFLCGADFPFQQDGTRREAGFRDFQQRWYREALANHGTAVVPLEGPLVRRVATALDIIRNAAQAKKKAPGDFSPGA